MSRYVILRSYSDSLDIPGNVIGASQCLKIVTNNTLDEVTWIHSYVSENKKQTFCVYDAPSPEAVRRAARRNNMPVDMILKVRVLDPYFYL
ncbi:MAG: DUF4242 domain-containing protein [Ignavibacterium sp.]|nr:MAG: DUF4242 domain-containing protein [Ignavibacterium sp.]